MRGGIKLKTLGRKLNPQKVKNGGASIELSGRGRGEPTKKKRQRVEGELSVVLKAGLVFR